MPRRFDLRSILLPLSLLLLAAGGRVLAATPWLPFGPDGGDARRFALDPHDHAHLYLGTANGWIYESHNSGANWKRVAQVGKRDDLVLDSIIVDPTDPRHLVVGAWTIDHPDGGVYLSYDGGRSWISQAEMRGQSVRAVALSPSDPKVMVAGTLRGIYRSTDGGQRWRIISPPDSTEIHEVQSVAIDPLDPNVIYAGTWHLPWKTADGGEHWDNIKQGIIDDSDVFSIIIDPKEPKTVFASACSGIYKSEDAGEQFRKVQGIPSAARRTRVLLQDPGHLETVFAGTTEGLWRSEDSGTKWARTTGSETVVNDVLVDSADSRHVLIATERGGVLASDDGGDTFQPSNGGFSTRQITAFKKDANNPARIYVGVVNDREWGGVFQSDNGGLAWSQRSNGLDGRDVFSLGQAPDGTIIAGTAHGLFRLAADADAWSRVEGAPAGSAAEPVHAAPLTRPPASIESNRYTKRTGLDKRTVESPNRTLAATRGARPKVKPSVPARGTTQGKPTAGASHRTTQTAAARTVGKMVAKPRAASGSLRPALASAASIAVVKTPEVAAKPKFFDGAVYGLATVDQSLLALTSIGLLSSADNGVTWQLLGPPEAADWRFLAATKTNAVAASLHTMNSSTDSGATWNAVKLPDGLTQIAAVAVEPSGELWVGGREGIFCSSDNGNTWTTPKNLFLNAVNSVYYDESSNRIFVTAGGANENAFAVQLPGKQVTFTDTGWNLRFVRPVGDHLVAVTLYDGIVIQPKLVASPMPAHETASR